MEIVTGEMNYNEDLCRLLVPPPVEGKHCLLFFNLKPDLRPRPSMSFAISNLGNLDFGEEEVFLDLKFTSLSFNQDTFPFVSFSRLQKVWPLHIPNTFTCQLQKRVESRYQT